ncbi:MAG: hypothetical protein JST00_19260 [Deltaproteobacteria bacterium]|nr:hypothetical protein [Deltaproteobacteria bacterium]
MRSRRRTCSIALAAMLVTFACGPAGAHVPDLTTARVTLRDGHAEISVDTDLVALAARELRGSGGAEGDATVVVTSDDAALASAMAAIRRDLAAGSHLYASGVEVPLVIRVFPSVEEVRRGAAPASAAHAASDEHRRTIVRLETTRSIGAARDLRVSLPSSVGRTLYTFVQPESRLASPGAAAELVVLQPPSSPPTVATPSRAEPASRSLLAVVAGVLALIAIAVQLRPWRVARRLGQRPRQAHEGGEHA